MICQREKMTPTALQCTGNASPPLKIISFSAWDSACSRTSEKEPAAHMMYLGGRN
jgi:hypothetical protein